MKFDGPSSQGRHLRFNLFRSKYFLCLMEHPIDVLLIMTYSAGFYGRILDKPEIKVDRHQRTRIVLPTMLCQRFTVDEIFHLSIRDLCYECMPSGNASTAGVKDIIFFPIGFRTEGPPGSSKQR